MKKKINILGIGDSLIKAKLDNGNGWGWRFSSYYAKYIGCDFKYFNCGQGGNVSSDLLMRLDHCLKMSNMWCIVIVGIGINDSRRRKSENGDFEVNVIKFADNMDKIFNILECSPIIEDILVAGLLPVVDELTTPLKEDKYYFDSDRILYNNVLKQIILSRKKLHYIDFERLWNNNISFNKKIFVPDGLHPSSLGHEIMANFAFNSFIKE